MKFRFDELLDRWNEISGLLDRDKVATGGLEDFLNISLVSSFPINELFVSQINNWRLKIARSVSSSHPELTVEALGDLSQKIYQPTDFYENV